MKMRSLKMFAFISFYFFPFLFSNAQDARNLLVTDINDYKFAAHVLTMDHSWIPYPAYNDRVSWSRIPEGIRKKNVEAGEEYLGYSWPNITATMYLEFTRNGNRDAIDRPIRERRSALRSLVMAELMEGKGRFLDDIINGVFTLCEQTYWGSSAHFYLMGYDHVSVSGSINEPYTVLPDNNNLIIDLFAAEVAADLAWTWYFFHEAFDKISPVISTRLKQELRKKILEPYYKRNDYWWMTGWGPGDRIFERGRWTMNNWSPWITNNILNIILLIEDDEEKKKQGVFKTMSTLNHFINMYPLDGGCDEGPVYWRHAGGKLFEYLDLLRINTNGNIDLLEQEVIRNMGRYIYRVYISKGKHYVNFSSAGPVIYHDGGHILRFGRAINDPVMQEFGAFLLREADFGNQAVNGSMRENLENLFNLEGWKDVKAKEPLLSDFYFPDSEIVIARDQNGSNNGFYFAAWGGDNGGGHNHDDNGSCIVHFNGHPVLIDVGRRGTVTSMHNLPVINGVSQPRGYIYKANNSKYTSSRSRVVFSTDIAGSYPHDAEVKKWVRSYTLQRGKKFIIRDDYELSGNLGNTKIYFMTELPCLIINPGTIEFPGNGFKLHMKYDPSLLSASIENEILGDEISRVVFDLNAKTLNGSIVFEIFEVK